MVSHLQNKRQLWRIWCYSLSNSEEPTFLLPPNHILKIKIIKLFYYLYKTEILTIIHNNNKQLRINRPFEIIDIPDHFLSNVGKFTIGKSEPFRYTVNILSLLSLSLWFCQNWTIRNLSLISKLGYKRFLLLLFSNDLRGRYTSPVLANGVGRLRQVVLLSLIFLLLFL